jgi:hypothetical protein
MQITRLSNDKIIVPRSEQADCDLLFYVLDVKVYTPASLIAARFGGTKGGDENGSTTRFYVSLLAASQPLNKGCIIEDS